MNRFSKTKTSKIMHDANKGLRGVECSHCGAFAPDIYGAFAAMNGRPGSINSAKSQILQKHYRVCLVRKGKEKAVAEELWFQQTIGAIQ